MAMRQAAKVVVTMERKEVEMEGRECRMEMRSDRTWSRLSRRRPNWQS